MMRRNGRRVRPFLLHAEVLSCLKILIIEDEEKTAEYLRNGLNEAGYTADWAANGIDGLHMARENAYDLILLDVMLPEMDGWTVMERLRIHLQTPVLFLSALGALEDRLRGLGLGADEYLVKPFSYAELLARIRIILRRGQPQSGNVLLLADLVVDIEKFRCERAGKRITLTNKEFKLQGRFRNLAEGSGVNNFESLHVNSLSPGHIGSPLLSWLHTRPNWLSACWLITLNQPAVVMSGF